MSTDVYLDFYSDTDMNTIRIGYLSNFICEPNQILFEAFKCWVSNNFVCFAYSFYFDEEFLVLYRMLYYNAFIQEQIEKNTVPLGYGTTMTTDIMSPDTLSFLLKELKSQQSLYDINHEHAFTNARIRVD